VARTLQQVEGSLTTGGYSAGGQSRGDIQDRIICGFHHGGALALESREGAEEDSFVQNLNSYVDENPVFFRVTMELTT